MRWLTAIAALLALDRLPPLPPAGQTETQRAAAKQFTTLRGREPFGPFVPLSRSPELMLAAASMGDYLRFHSALPPEVREVAILLTCREWTQQYEWSAHARLAVEVGVRRDLIDAIADGRRPYGAPEDVETAIELVSEILAHKRVSDSTWHRAVRQFGENGAVDLLAITGYYSFLGVILNGARTP